MKVLVAIEFAPSRFRKLAVYSVRSNGTMALPNKYNGQIEGAIWRSAVKTLLSDSAINWVDCQYGSSPVYRLSRV